MSTRDEQGRRIIYMMHSADLLAETDERVIVRLIGETPGVIAAFELNSPQELEDFIRHLIDTARLAWPSEITWGYLR